MQWLRWASMKAKVPKCHVVSLEGSTGRTVDLKLTCALPIGHQILIQIPHDLSQAKLNVKEKTGHSTASS